MSSLRAGYEAGSDMLEFDVRVTSDNVPVLMHDSSLLRTNGLRHTIRACTLQELILVTQGTDKPIATLDEVMAELFGKVMLNIEVKQHGSADALVAVFKKYCKTDADWTKFVISSFYVKELQKIRKQCPQASLWMLHNRNPFMFVAYARRLQLNGVGFNRMYLNDFALEIARKTNLLTYVYTVNRLGALQNLSDKGIDGVVTNYPDKFVALVASTKPD